MPLLGFDPGKPSTISTAQAKQNEQGIMGDMVDNFQSGIASSVGSMFDMVGADGMAKSFRNIADEQHSQMSSSGQESLAKPMFQTNDQGETELGEGMTDLDTWLLNFAGIAGQLVSTAVPGAGAAGLATKALSLGSKGAKVAQAVGMGVTGGSAATGQAMEQASQEYLKMPDDIKAQSPLFQKYYRQIQSEQPDLDVDSKWALADKRLDEQLKNEVRSDPKVLLANFAASAIGDPVIGRALTGVRLAKSGALRSALAGGITEGATEATQAGVSQYAVDNVLSQIDQRDPMAGVKLAALNEGIIGAGFGAGAGSIGGLANRNPANREPVNSQPAKNPAADPIRESNPTVAGAMDADAQQAADRRAQIDSMADSMAQASQAQQTQQPNYDQPTAARRAGMGDTMQAGRFGDEAIARDNAMKGRSFPTVPEQFNKSPLTQAMDSVQGLTDQSREGEWLPPLSEQERQGSSPVTGLLAAPFIDGENLSRQHTRDTMAAQPTNLIGQSDTIFANDGRARQAAQQFADTTARQTAAEPKQITDKGIIFAPDTTAVNKESPQSQGINVKSNNTPFASAKEALISKGARAAKREGAEVESVKLDNGFGWRVVPKADARTDGTTDTVGESGLTLLHGSPNPALNIDDIEIVRTGQKQGKKGRSYGGFYATSEADIEQAQGYASMADGSPTIHNISIKPNTKVLNKTGDITRLSENYINELTAQGYGLVVGKDPRGRTEYVVIDKNAIKTISPMENIKPKKSEPAQDLAGDKIDNEWTAFAPETGTLNIPRSEMPQIKAEHRGAMVNFMKARGVDHTTEEVPADSLKPTQAEFSPAKVKKALGFEGGDRSILVSSDNHVLDGHHQWLTKREKGEQIKVIRLNAPIKELINLAREFPSSETQAGATQAVDNKASKKGEKAEMAKTAINDSNETPAILRTSKTKWVQAEIKKQGFKKGSPGYDDAVSKLNDSYETEIDKALAESSFETYQQFNSDTPESINRMAYAELRKEFGLDAQEANTEKTVTKKPKATAATKKPKAKEEPKAVDDSDQLSFFDKPKRGKNKGARLFTQGEAQRAVNDVIAKLSGGAGVRVNLFTSQDEFLKRFNLSSMEMEGQTIYGAYDDKRHSAYLILDNFSSIDDLRSTLVHEVLAHGGLHTVIGAQKYQQFIAKLNSSRSRKEFKELWAKIDKDYAGASDAVKAEEVFANFVQNQPERGTAKAWWFELTKWLRRQLEGLGIIKSNITRNEMEDMMQAIVRGFDKRKQRMDRANKVLDARDESPSDILFSKAATAPDERTAKQKLGLEEEAEQTLKEKITENYRNTADTLKQSSFWSRLNEGIFDGLHGIKKAEEAAGITDPNKMGYVSARLASGLSDVLHGVFHYGAPMWKDGIIQRKADTKGLLEVFGMLPDGELNNWLAWMGANRAKQLKAQGRENNLSQADIDELLALADGKEKLFEDVRAEYNKINSAVLDMAQGAGLISEAQRAGFDEQYYVPFFRDIEADAGFEEFAAVYAPNSKKGIAGQKPKIQELKGGKQSTKDLLENIILRQSTMIDAALKNKAMLEVVENLDGTGFMDKITANEYSLLSEDEQKRTVRMMVNGKQQRVVVSDPALLRALMAINDVSSRSLFNRMGRSAKRFLTAGITLSPDFILKNFIRDAAHAWMINKDDFKLGIDSVNGLKKAFKEDEAYRDLIFSGAAFQGGYVHGADPEAAAQQIRRALSKKGLTAKQIDSYMGSLVTNSKKLFEVYRNFSDKFENANRLSTYEAALRSGKSRRQAAFEAKDLMDYSLKGNFALISTMIDFLPFFNARLQGMYKLARASAAGENDKVLKVLSANLAMKGLKVAAFSLALAAWNEDDERYKKLPDWDKDANWHFWLGDHEIRIPKPFELGIMFGTLPERLFNFGTGSQTGSDLGRATASALFNTMALNPLPQFALPAIEVIVNKSFFKWTDIEGMGDENRMPGDRYNAYTSDTAREIGKFFNVSPKKIEHLVNGYAGTLGAYVLAISDIMARQMLGRESAETPISRYPVIKAFYGGDAPKGNTYYQNEFYKALDAANQAYGSYKRAAEEQDSSRMMAVLEDNRDKLGVRIALNRVQRQVSALSKQAEIVNNSSMNPSEKREKLDAITRQKNAIYQSAYVGFNLREW
ncbi:LPD38 domain-containing protein [Shewanella sp. Koi 1]